MKTMKKILLFIMMAVFTLGVHVIKAQNLPVKVVTNHPDFKIKVTRCEASGSTVVIDMLFTNQGSKDVEDVQVLCWAMGYPQSVAYDNEGNIYKEMSAKVSGEGDSNGNTPWFSILQDVPMKVSVTIEKVSETAERIVKLSLDVECETWGINSDKPVIIRNIPITRESE